MKTISDEKTSMVSYNEPQIKVVEALEEIQSEVRDIFTYLDSAAFILKSVFSSSIFSIFEKNTKILDQVALNLILNGFSKTGLRAP